MSSLMAAMRFIICCGLLLIGAWGCASPDAESDLPWNMSQPWESSRGLPGGFGEY